MTPAFLYIQTLHKEQSFHKKYCKDPNCGVSVRIFYNIAQEYLPLVGSFERTEALSLVKDMEKVV